MDIKRVSIDAVNEVIVMQVVHMDYKGQVQKRINEKMPLATVKGFRKGQVPKDLVAKQYGKKIKIEEVQKVIDLALSRYIESERLPLLGNPLLKNNDDFSWDDESLTFEYEIGLAPDFELNLEASNNIVKYIIKADDELIDNQINRIQKQFGTRTEAEIVDVNTEITGNFSNDFEAINHTNTFQISIFKDLNVQNLFVGKKAGDTVKISTKGLFEDDHDLMDLLNINHDKVHDLAIEVDFKIEKINTVALADLNQELFDKLFGQGNINSVESLKQKIKEDAETSLTQQAEQKLLMDVQDFLIENTKFELPKAFLIKWLQTTGEKKLSQEEAEIEFNRSEKGLRYQLIESKALAQSDIKINFEDLKSFTTNAIKQQMAQFGQLNPTDEEVQSIVARVLSNQEEVKRLSQQVVTSKMIVIFKEKANPTPKEVSYKEFVAAMYGE